MKSVDELVEQSTQPFLALALIRCSVSTSLSLSSGRVEIDLMEVKNGDNNQLAVLFTYLISILQNRLVLVKWESFDCHQHVLLPDVEVVFFCVMRVFIVPDVPSCCSICTIVVS